MRTFKLYNNDGVAFDLTLVESAFFYDVSGLGFELDEEYVAVAEQYKRIKSSISQLPIEGIVKFWQPGAYHDYFRFSQFCQNAPLYLEYAPDGEVFTRKCIVSAIEKTESTDGQLIARVSLTPLTPWYVFKSEYSSGNDENGKRYNYTYNYRYSNSASRSITMISDSYLPSPMKLTIFGAARNPQWFHYLNGKLVGSGGVTIDVSENQKVVIDTTQVPYSISLYDLANNYISDIYQNSDFSTERFFKIEHGRNVIAVSEEGGRVIKMRVEAMIEYASV